MRLLTLTGLGNEMDLGSGRSIFIAVFNKDIRIEISKEAAETLTNAIYSSAPANKSIFTKEEYEEAEQGVREESEKLAGVPELEDVPSSIYDEDTGVEQV